MKAAYALAAICALIALVAGAVASVAVLAVVRTAREEISIARQEADTFRAAAGKLPAVMTAVPLDDLTQQARGRR